MKNGGHIFNMVVTLSLLGATSCAWLRVASSPQGDGVDVSSPSREAEKSFEWFNDFPRYIIPRICAYYQLHPERFKPTEVGEEIEISGLAAFLKKDGYFKQGYRSSIWSGKLRDPWGDLVHFVEDLNGDGYIEAGGERIKVINQAVDGNVEFTNQEHHFGIWTKTTFRLSGAEPPQRIVARTFYDVRIHKR